MRLLTRVPAFTMAAVLTLAAGSGAVVAMGVIYWAVVVTPVRLPDPDRLLSVAREQRDPQVPTALSWPRVQAIRSGSPSFSAVAAYSNETVNLSGFGGAPRELRGLRVSDGFFNALSIAPVRGRPFVPAEDATNGPAVCMLSYETWQDLFGGAEIVGTTIRLGSRPTEVVGILGPHLSAPWGDREVFLPRVFEDSQLTSASIAAGASYLSVVARLAPNQHVAQATAELRAVSRAFRAQFAGRSDTINDVEIKTLAEIVIAGRGQTLGLMMCAVVLVLLVASANVAALVTGRVASRRREFAVRQALGASRLSCAGHVIVEGAMLSTLAGIAGLALAAAALRTIVATLGNVLPPGADLQIGLPALVLALSTVLFTTFLIGVVPGVMAMRASGLQWVATSARGQSETARTLRGRQALVVAEVALSTCLLIAASLFMASLRRTLAADVGFEPAGVAAGKITPPVDIQTNADAQRTFFLDALERLQHSPGIQAAAIVYGLPFANDNVVSPYVIAGRVIPPPAERRRAGLRVVTEDYLPVMRLRLAAGRFFTAADVAGGHPVCVINRSFARREFGDRSPLGATVLRGRDADQPFEIVGLIDDVKTNGPNNPVPDELFLSFRQVPRQSGWLVVRTATRPDMAASLMQTAIAGVDRDVPVAGFTTMDDALGNTIGPERLLAGLTGTFSCLALLLAAIGLYAVLAHMVTARTNEIGIRMAIGAQRQSILGLIVGTAMRLVAAGIAIGVVGALALGRVLQAQLHGISARDPYVCTIVSAVFAGVGVAASLVPAHRATRVDPVAVLNAH